MANLTLVAGKLGLTDGNDIGPSASRAMLARRASYGVNFNAVWCWSIWPLTLPYLPHCRNSTSKLGLSGPLARYSSRHSSRVLPW